jgi:formamidase
VTLRVDLLKGRTLQGPVLFPLLEDLPPLARPLDESEMTRARHLAAKWGIDKVEESAPISVVGSGPNLNSATEVGLRRAAHLLSMTVPEVMNRATITGGIEIGRHPGVVQITFRAPLAALENAGLLPFVREQYGIG